VTQPDGTWIAYSYDYANGLIGVDDSLGNAIDYELDVMGNRVGETVDDPQQTLRKSLQRIYDAGNRLKRDVNSVGQYSEYGVDGNGNVTTVTSPTLRVTTNAYDPLERLVNINDAAAGNTVFGYDAKDRLASVKDPKLSVATTYGYDGLGNLTSQVSPDTGTTTFTPDGAGNVATQTDALRLLAMANVCVMESAEFGRHFLESMRRYERPKRHIHRQVRRRAKQSPHRSPG